MEIICAGYPKTASKSCSMALRMLGYKVADYLETTGDLAREWNDFIYGKSTIKPVIEKYKKCGYQANQDVPGNFYWKDLYDASPDAKVILTVRDDVETWRNSWRTFMKQEYSRLGNPGFIIQTKINDWGLGGPEFSMMEANLTKAFYKIIPEFDNSKRHWTWQNSFEYFDQFNEKFAEKYAEHIEYVKKTVPPERLLVWNLKDGWEPLCTFLNKPVPSEPVPRENTTGDMKYMEKFFYESKIYKKMMNFCMILVIIAIVLILLDIFGII